MYMRETKYEIIPESSPIVNWDSTWKKHKCRSDTVTQYVPCCTSVKFCSRIVVLIVLVMSPDACMKKKKEELKDMISNRKGCTRKAIRGGHTLENTDMLNGGVPPTTLTAIQPSASPGWLV